jgi:hypothetical protein
VHHPSQIRRSDRLDLEVFFADFCPKSLLARASRGHADRGRVAFYFVEDGRAFVVDLEARSVSEGAPSGPVDLLCRFTTPAFEELLAGQLDARAAIEGGDVDLAGDLDLLATLSEIFAPVS